MADRWHPDLDASHKAAVERILDRIEAATPELRVVRFRPGLIFQARAASEIARYLLGPFVPLSALRRRFIPVIPAFDRLVFQAVHTDDVAAAVDRAVLDSSVRGAFNLAADPVLDARVLAEALHARRSPVPFSGLRGRRRRVSGQVVSARRRLARDGSAVPVMSTERARSVLGWQPRHSSTDALLELLEGMHEGAGQPTPPLRSAPSPAGRILQAARTVIHGGPGAENP